MSDRPPRSIGSRMRWFFLAVVVALTTVAAIVTVILIRRANERDAIADAEATALAGTRTVRIQVIDQLDAGARPNGRIVQVVVRTLQRSLSIQDAEIIRISDEGIVSVRTDDSEGPNAEPTLRLTGVPAASLDVEALRNGQQVSFTQGGNAVSAAPLRFTRLEAEDLRLRDDVIAVVAVRRLGTAGLGSVGPALLLGAIAALAVGAILSEVLARRVRRPLQAVASAAHAISAGDLSARVALPSGADREVTEVAATVDTMATKLDDARRDRQQFLIDVSHELRTPLTSIAGYAELLNDAQLTAPDEVSEAGAVIAREAARIRRLTDDLLTQARLDTGEMNVALEPVDIGAVAESVAAAHRPDGQRIGVDIVTRTEPLLVDADEIRLQQVIGNLTDNAIGFAAGQVTVSVSADSYTAMLVVADDGPGLGSAAATVFERSFTTDRPRDRRGNLGVGLSVAAGLVHAMGGSIEAGNGVVGARFVVRLPLSSSPS